ncbi:MAG: DUF5666 domain-containing protein [Candidatus Sulfotelmatobacter sp.]
MKRKATRTAIVVIVSVIILSGPHFQSACFASAIESAQDASQPAVAKRIGAIKAINGNVITLAPDSGPEVAVTVQPNARLLRLVPGDKDLKNAIAIQLQDLQVGDTIRARGQGATDGKSIAALEIIVITRSAVQAVSDQIRQDWQKRGVGGPVTVVDPAAETVTISISGLGSKKAVVVHASKNTVIRRYSPDSAKPEDAKVSTLQEIQVGDQLRARGDRSADGSELAAEEIFTGNFPVVEGLIKSVDASTGTMTVQDMISKKAVVLKITADSQLHKIPAEMAQRFAMRLKAALPPGTPGAGPGPSASATPPAGTSGQASTSPAGGGQGAGMGQGGTAGGGGMGGARSGGGGFDFQRLLDQTPPVVLADLHKGDAVAVLATQGTPANGSAVIKLFSGVEPILQAAPSGSQAMMLAPWSLGGAPGGDASQ